VCVFVCVYVSVCISQTAVCANVELKKEHALALGAIRAELAHMSGETAVNAPVFPMQSHWSFERLSKDPLMAAQVKAITTFPTVRAFELFFDLIMAYTDGETPRQYRAPGAADERKTTRSARWEPRDISLNKFFFCIFVLKTGPESLAVAGIVFGFDANFVERYQLQFGLPGGAPRKTFALISLGGTLRGHGHSSWC